MQLHHFDALNDVDIDLARAELIVCMPTLQDVESCSITPDALRLLAHGLPDLHTLQLRVHVSGSSPDSEWAVVCEGLAACHQLTALTLWEPPLEELAALFLALPPLLRKLDIHECGGFLQSAAFFQCVAEGGLRHLELLRVWLPRSEQPRVAAWQECRRACAPWIHAEITV